MRFKSASGGPHGSNTRINLTLPKALLEEIDKAAVRDFQNRSEVIRAALMWYLRPDRVNFGQTEPEAMLGLLKREVGMTMYEKARKGYHPYQKGPDTIES
jgi:metal-responsive CopG/Arc/MetJ family transcriptional regulator